MDHLPAIDTSVDPIIIPYYGGIFDDGDWDTFPSRLGWFQNRYYPVLDFRAEEHTDEEVISLLQAWFYFGLLCQFLRKPFDDVLTQFTTMKDGLRIVQTKSMPDTLRELFATNKINPNRHAAQCHFKTAQRFRIEALDRVLPKGLVVAQGILLESLQSLCPGSSVTTLSTLDSLKDDLIAFGCCPSSLGPFIRLGSSGLYVRYLMGQSKSEHRHVRCEENACLALRTTEGVYKSGHASHCSGTSYYDSVSKEQLDCRWINPDIKALETILYSDTIPILSIRRIGRDIYLEYVPFEKGIRYTAISHVLADGMGNFEKNEVRACQAADIDQLLRAMNSQQSGQTSFTDPRYTYVHSERYIPRSSDTFWLDTLCIPVKGNAYRKKALVSIRKVYQEAANVLILDNELRKLDPTNDLTLAMAVVTSSWASRLWTLEEAAAARLPWIQFSKSVVNLQQVEDRLFQFDGPYNEQDHASGWEGTWAWCEAVRGLAATINTWTSYSQVGTAPTPMWTRYRSLVRALESRDTSKFSDEAVCLASILDLDLRPIVNSVEGKQMATFWSIQSYIPLNFLFLRVPRLSIPGLKWAPSSLLRLHRFDNFSANVTQHTAQVTPQGLTFHSQGYILPSCGRVVDWKIAFRLEQDGFEAKLISIEDCLPYKDLRLDLIKEFAVIHTKDRPYGKKDSLSETCQVALLNVTSRSSTIIHTEFIGIMVLLTDGMPLLPDVKSTEVVAELVDADWVVS